MRLASFSTCEKRAAHPGSGILEWYERHTPLARHGRVDDVAALVRFLLSDEAVFISGSVYMCDGVLTAAGPVVVTE